MSESINEQKRVLTAETDLLLLTVQAHFKGRNNIMDYHNQADAYLQDDFQGVLWM